MMNHNVLVMMLSWNLSHNFGPSQNYVKTETMFNGLSLFNRFSHFVLKKLAFITRINESKIVLNYIITPIIFHLNMVIFMTLKRHNISNEPRIVFKLTEPDKRIQI